MVQTYFGILGETRKTFSCNKETPKEECLIFYRDKMVLKELH